jgi:hypothetical protein
MVFPEHLLLAIARDAESNSAKMLLESTMDVPRLEEAVGKLNKYSW